MTKGLCPFADHLLIPPGPNDPPIRPRTAILHVDAGNAASLFRFFSRRSGGIESHFHIRKDGRIEQYRNIYWQADANHRANDFAVSIETQGRGSGVWTSAQLAAIRRLLLWLNEEAGIPLVKCPRWDAAGVGYHVQFGAPGPWTPVAKSCPGPNRIKQFNSVLVPWMQEHVTASTEEESTLSWNEKIAKWAPGGQDTPGDKDKAGKQLNQARGYAQEAYKATVRIEAAVAALTTALGPEVQAAVNEALRDAMVQVDVNVAQGDSDSED